MKLCVLKVVDEKRRTVFGIKIKILRGEESEELRSDPRSDGGRPMRGSGTSSE